MMYDGRVGFSCGTGRCGTKFLVELLTLEPEVAACHERNPENETFHRYCKWNGLPVDHEGFLRIKQGEIDDDLIRARVSIEASAHLSLSILELFDRFRARFVLLVRRPDLVVNSYLRKGWYEQPIVRNDPDLVLGFQPNQPIHHFLGRVVPSGEEYLRWQRLTRVGRLGWYWNELNTRVLDQFSQIPESHHRIVRLEDFDHATYGEIGSFLGFEPTLSQHQFEAIARERPNALDHVPRWSHWDGREAEEFEREVAPMSLTLGYPSSVSDLPATEPAPAPITLRRTTDLARQLQKRKISLRRAALGAMWLGGRAVGAVPRRPLDLLYISNGNIPSRWANTIQTMKMSEAFGELVSEFGLLIATGMAEWIAGRVDLRPMYGIRNGFPIFRLPTSLALHPDREHGVDRRFVRFSPTYAQRLGARLVYTRSRRVGAGCLAFGVSVIFEIHDGPANRTERRRLEEIVQHPLLAGVVVLNDSVRGLVRSAGGIGDKIIVLPSAVDPTPYDEAPTRDAARERLRLPNDRPIAMYAGHLYDYKGIAPLLDAARLRPEILFLLLGGWPEDVERWRRAAADLPNVRFEGFVANAEIPMWLAAADICVHPHSARHEYATWTSPLKLFEYMASSRPIVATDIPALRELLVHGANAIVVPPDSAQGLADGVGRILDDHKLAERLAHRARKDVDALTWKDRARAVLERFAPDLL